MALQFQNIPVSFAGGLDQKVAEQLTVPGKFLVLENCVRRKLGRIQKRNGFTNLDNSVIGSSDTITSGMLLSKLNNDLVMADVDTLYSYLPGRNQWVSKGAIDTVESTVEPIIRNNEVQANCDMVIYKGYQATVWEDSRGGVRALIQDAESGAIIFTDTELSPTGVRPKVIGTNNVLMFFYLESTTMQARIFPLSALNTLPAEVTVDTGVTSATWHVVPYADSAAIYVWAKTGGFNVGYILTNGDLGNGANGRPASVEVTLANQRGLGLVVNEAQNAIYVLTSVTAPSAAVIGYAYSLNLINTDNDSYPTTESLSATVAPIGVIDADGGARFIVSNVYYPMVYAANTLTLGTKTTYTTQTSTAAGGTFSPVGGAFLYGSKVYVVGSTSSALQSTLFVLEVSPTTDVFVSRNLVGLAGGAPVAADLATARSGFCRVNTDDNVNFSIAVQIKNELLANEDGVYAPYRGLTKISYSFGTRALSTSQLGDNLHLAGGIVQNYDGQSVTEHGFLFYPEDVGSSTSTSGGTLAAGIYYYRVLWEWVDAKGQIHQSAPSTTIAITTTGSTSVNTIDNKLLALTRKKTPTRTGIKYVIYRGIINDDQVLYRLGEISVGTADFDDTGSISDAVLSTKEVLYTTGGVLENDAPLACKVIAQHKNRLFISGTRDVGYVYYSRQFVNGEGVAFSGFLSFPVDPQGGEITGLGTLDDKLIIFKQDSIYSVVGDGPNDLGQQSDFSQPQRVAGDVGCNNPRSIVETPEGLLFKSDKGIYLIGRSLDVLYIGQDVEDFNHLTISSAVVLEDVNEVRFTTTDGSAIIYNYQFQQWSTFSNYEATSALNYRGGYYHLKENGLVRVESDAFLDAGSKIKMSIETSWLAFAGLQGYQRIRSWMLLGDFLTDHYTKVKLFYDYEKFASETVYFNVDNGLDLSYYGDDATYGDSTVYGGDGSGVFQFTSQPRVQKCQAMKMRIEDIDTKVIGGGGSFTLVGLTLNVGLKDTLTKQLDGNKRVGS